MIGEVLPHRKIQKSVARFTLNATAANADARAGIVVPQTAWPQ